MTTDTRGASPWLLVVAAFGLLVPNGLFIHWLLVEFDGVGQVLRNELALGFMLDAVMALALLCAYFARRPIGPYRWPWFLVLSLVGGLGFSLPFYWWLNRRPAAAEAAGG